jgi:hypothetical protein
MGTWYRRRYEQRPRCYRHQPLARLMTSLAGGVTMGRESAGMSLGEALRVVRDQESLRRGRFGIPWCRP